MSFRLAQGVGVLEIGESTGSTRLKSRVRWWWLILAAALVTVVVLAGAALQRRMDDTRLLRLTPDEALRHPEVVRYAARRARPLYAAHCAECHGAAMQGDPDRGTPNLADGEWIYGSGHPSEIEQTILYGIRSGHHRAHDLADMPAFGQQHPYRRYVLPTFTPSQIADLAEFVVAIGKRPADSVAAKRGQALFYNGGQCYDCHTSDASGDNFAGAPSLVDQVWLYGHGTRQDIVRTITEGRDGVCPAWVRRLRPAEVRALAVYIGAKAQRALARPS